MKKGFTLVELVVIVGVLGIVMVSISGILINSLRGKNRMAVADLVEQNGSFVIGELRKNVYNGAITGCTNGNSLGVSSKADNKPTTISCQAGGIGTGKVASTSAEFGEVPLTGGNLAVICGSSGWFVECVNDGSGKLMKIVFTFGLTAGSAQAGPAGYADRVFTTEVAVRD